MRTQIPQRRTLLVGCEGKSEVGYVRWLGRLTNTFAITTHDLQGGDPLDLVGRMGEKIETDKKIHGRKYDFFALLLDTDLCLAKPERTQEAKSLAKRKRIHLIWQAPAHEGLLLHHFHEHQNVKPVSATRAKELLLNVWPRYRKGMDATGYEKVLTLDHLAVARAVEPSLNDFLVAIGWD